MTATAPPERKREGIAGSSPHRPRAASHTSVPPVRTVAPPPRGTARSAPQRPQSPAWASESTTKLKIHRPLHQIRHPQAQADVLAQNHLPSATRTRVTLPPSQRASRVAPEAHSDGGMAGKGVVWGAVARVWRATRVALRERRERGGENSSIKVLGMIVV
jgi:hypothetical protein